MNTDEFEGHTPAPWTDYDAHSVGVKGNARHSDQRIAIMDLKPEADVKQAEHIANRKLIAAAPLLLDMLNELLEECRMHYWCYESENDDDVCARCGGNNEHKEWCDL
jgi:hypothetical protein